MNAFVLAAMLAACGGGGDSSAAAAPMGNAATAAATVSTGSGGGTTVVAPIDALAATAQLAGAQTMSALASGTPNAAVTSNSIRATGACAAAFVPPAALTLTSAAPMPISGGVFFSSAEVTAWKQRITSGPFAAAGDYRAGSPGDWATITQSRQNFLAGREGPWTLANSTQDRAKHLTLLRDAAFSQLLQPDAALLGRIRSALLGEASNPLNDFAARLCLRTLDDSVHDAEFFEASWLLRYVVAYDFVRASLAAADRLAIDNFVRRNAYFFAAQLDYGLVMIFPDRAAGGYTRKGRDAAASGDAAYASMRGDSNGDCRIDSLDDPASYPVRNYVRGDASAGPRTSVLSQWFNNRRAVAAAAFGSAGVLLADADLIVRAKRYTMEWLTYGVWPDGSEGEYLRNGDYCIPQQGLVYAAANINSALLIGQALARQGDRSLFDFRTRSGLFGTEATGSDAPKSIELVAGTRLKLLNGQLPWYQYEVHKTAAQKPRAATALGQTQSRYMNSGTPTDTYQEIGLLLGARYLTALPIDGVVLRDPKATALPFPGATGLAVDTGYGSWVGHWTDSFNALPALLLLR